MDRRRGALVRELVELLQLLSRKQWFMGNTDLTLDEFLVLDLVEERGNCTMGEVADSFSMPRSTLTGIIDRLERKDFVRRVRSGDDRRRVRIGTTRRGKKAYEKFRSSALQKVDTALSHLSDDELVDLIAIVRRLAGALGLPGAR